jgi:hypothetical protein
MSNAKASPSLDQYVKKSRSDFEDKLATLVEIPSISMDPERHADILKCGETAAQYLRDVGAQASASRPLEIQLSLAALSPTARTRPSRYITTLTCNQPTLPSGIDLRFRSTSRETRYDGRGTNMMTKGRP